MQAPIGPAASVDLVAAVSGTGALGTLAASWTPVAELREKVRALRLALADPFCVNLVLAFEQRERLLMALAEGASVVSFSWGIDSELIGLVHDADGYAMVQVGHLDDAEAAVRAGADALIVQGVEAGGHVQATQPLLELVRQVRERVRVPLVAAGGVGDATDVQEVREAGADAVACGTLFLAANEANVHPEYLDSLVNAGANDTTLTTVFEGGWPDAPHRVVRNETVDLWEAAAMPAPGSRPGEGETVATRRGRLVLRYDGAQPTRDTVGDVTAMALYAGTSVRAIARREPASSVVQRIVNAFR